MLAQEDYKPAKMAIDLTLIPAQPFFRQGQRQPADRLPVYRLLPLARSHFKRRKASPLRLAFLKQ